MSFTFGSGKQTHSQWKKVYIFPKWKLKIPNGRFAKKIIIYISIFCYLPSKFNHSKYNTGHSFILNFEAYFAKQQHKFPNFSQNAANFPNSKGPGPIPKMVKKTLRKQLSLFSISTFLIVSRVVTIQ